MNPLTQFFRHRRVRKLRRFLDEERHVITALADGPVSPARTDLFVRVPTIIEMRRLGYLTWGRNDSGGGLLYLTESGRELLTMIRVGEWDPDYLAEKYADIVTWQ